MKKDSSTECWSKLGSEWIEKAQTNDFRMYYIMPNTIGKFGDVKGEKILDLGCGEGGYSRELAKKGAIVTSIDCSEEPLEYAKKKAEEEQLEIKHYMRNSNNLYGLEDNIFDDVLSSMMIMDVEDLNGTLKEIYRVLKPGGKVFISMLHPCFKPPVEHKWFSNDGEIQVIVKDYYNPTEWNGSITGLERTVVYRHKTLSEYVKFFVKNGFILLDMDEPIPTEEQIKMSHRIEWLTKIPMYLFMELVKPKIDIYEMFG